MYNQSPLSSSAATGLIGTGTAGALTGWYWLLMLAAMFAIVGAVLATKRMLPVLSRGRLQPTGKRKRPVGRLYRQK